MAAKKSNSIGNRNQLKLPFGIQHDHGWDVQEHADNVVCLRQRTEEKERSARHEHRKTMAKKLVGFADSLDW